MFKAPIKMLHPLLTATQDGTYVGTENVGALPYQGIILAHSNESRVAELPQGEQEQRGLPGPHLRGQGAVLPAGDRGGAKIYDKLMAQLRAVGRRRCAPGTLDMLANFSVLSRLKPHENSSALYSKMRIYDGESLKDTDPSRQVAPGVPRRRRRGRGHGRHVHPLRL